MSKKKNKSKDKYLPCYCTFSDCENKINCLQYMSEKEFDDFSLNIVKIPRYTSKPLCHSQYK